MFKNLKEAKRNLSDKQFVTLHKKANAAAKTLQSSEVDFIRALQIVHSNMVHRWCGYNSLFKYGVHCLDLSTSQSYMYGSLAKATKKLKKFEHALIEGQINPSKAARVLSVINEDNEEEWIQKAKTLPKHQLEKEVVKLNPKKVKGERSVYLTKDVIDLKTPVSESVYKQLVRVQDLMSQAEGRSVPMEDVFKELSNTYLKKKDPLLKAERFNSREEKKSKTKGESVRNIQNDSASGSTPVSEVSWGTLNSEELAGNRPKEGDRRTSSTRRNKVDVSYASKNEFGQRRAIPSKVEHRVHLRDQRECQHEYPSGEKCREKRWIHLHHKLPISQGGDHRPENLLSLCSNHHELVHLLMNDGSKAKQLPNNQSYPSFSFKGDGASTFK